MLDDRLLEVRKPARYIGQEWNISNKDFDQSGVKFALCFPDLYEVGMSNIGIRIIYGLLNSIEDIVCERFFSPGADMEALIRTKRIELLSLESKKRLEDFDIIGFSLGYELCFTNVLNILDLGGIPLESSARGRTLPLVIAGGPCVFNPEPMHEFFDLFVMGEAEEAALEIIDIYREYKDKYRSGAISKPEFLSKFCGIEGVYVPSLYKVDYDASGKIDKFVPSQGAPAKIKKRFIADLDKAFFPRQWLVPYIQIVHDRITMEIMRGCPNRCRFCQARSIYFPFRIKEQSKILDSASDIYRLTGYEEISLCGLSVSEYPHIESLLQSLISFFAKKAVSVSLPSVKPKAYMGDLSLLISTIKKTGLTFAPEAASPRLRDILAKDFNEEEFFAAVEKAYAAGYQRIKLYFMIGLPGEQEEDLNGIIDFAVRVSELRRRVQKGPAWVNLSINSLIPKPHTPFQWFGCSGEEEIVHKQEYLKKKNKSGKIKLSFHNYQMSQLEAVFSRGDRRLGSVIRIAFKLGARFDAWEDSFQYDIWMRAFREAGIDINFYTKQRERDERLPWDFLDLGIVKETLLSEYEKVIAIK